ncbi:glycoside hydrolase family 3 N-terminal domain-containing protein [Flavobacterium sp. MMLR14_040]|uniref:glycoside hydrolase family 3 N-terminal domain-containing protein n=1 Tax=Flavobacterium sp. MMLR14_040 TaxID=3093843 RepID=UPI00298F5A32|nr:glycoside hydrolase family 3 N-terminal domain-containing protein [Flavobacterium sp. MMLR14_040]MDW8852441.1 glycoside hydrolase family 3 N-terminal domain-containing protein [Flavobacterium sp. MMLR14_040]
MLQLKIKKTAIIFVMAVGFFNQTYAQKKYPYQDAKLPVEDRVKDLLSRMTLEEKARQMDMYRGELFKEKEDFSKSKSDAKIGNLGIGAIHDLYPRSAKMINDLQSEVIKNNKWGIPALIMCEMLHGYLDDGSTAFPMNISLGATWDTNVMDKVGKVIAMEARAHGVHFGLGPNLDLGREPRWGRVAETFGEDAYLNSEIGLAMIKGMQGDDLRSDRTIISEPKHFAVHGIPQAGGNSSPILVGERSAREDHLPSFEKAFRKGGALGTMCAYSELDGIPCAANHWLLTDVLRKEWGFKGIVVSDLGAIKYLQTTHYVTNSPKESIREAVAAGVDMQFYDFTNEFWQQSIIELVGEKKLTMEQIDRAAGGVLRLKFLLGLFENPYTDKKLIKERFHTKENQEAALEAGRKSIILLKNDNNILPLSKDIKTVAVIGPNADASRLGGYAVKNKVGTTVLEGIKQVAGAKTNVLYEEGVSLIVKGQIIPSKFLFTPDGSQNGLKGEYFNNRNVEGNPVLTRIDNQLEFDWPWSPGDGVTDDDFSIRWTGYIQSEKSFDGWLGLSSDDGIRMWVDDQLVIDNWTKGATSMVTTPKNIEAGKKYKVRIEMWEGGWGARAHLRWNLEKVNFQPAIDIAKKADVAIVVLGESNELVEENRDVASLDLHGMQQELIEAIQKTGTPVVCVLLNGRPLSTNWISENIPALVEAWFPGEAGGRAVADVLFGDYNPGGRLPITVPKSVGQLPIYYNQKPSAIHRYVSESENPLYTFGYGLSYTKFEYSNFAINTKEIKADGELKVSVDVKNTGNYDGDEVVQLYIKDVYSSVTTPRKTLKGFKRLFIKKGETKKVEFTLTADELSIWNREMKRVVEPGDFEVMVGGNSTDLQKLNFKVVE